MAGSIRKFDEDTQYMQTIVEGIQAHGDQIAFNWFAAAKDRTERQSQPEEAFNWEAIVEDNVRALHDADALIVECSRFNWGGGYQTAIALQLNKPVLNLCRRNSSEYKEWADKLFLSGIASPLFHFVVYENQDGLQQSVLTFLDSITPKTVDIDVRLSLDRSVAQQLNQLAFQTGKSQSSLVKDLVQKNIS